MDDSSQELVRSKQKKTGELLTGATLKKKDHICVPGMSQVRAEMIEVVVRLLDAWPKLSSKTPAKQTQSGQSSQGKTKRCTKKTAQLRLIHGPFTPRASRAVKGG